METCELGLDIETLLIENEIEYLARKYNVHIAHVCQIMTEVGNNRQEIEDHLIKHEKHKKP